MTKVTITFLPVIHKGVISFLSESKAEKVYLVNWDDVEGFDYLSREIRALSFEDNVKILKSLGFSAFPFNEHIDELTHEDVEIIMPEEDISHALALKYFSHKKIIFNTTFLRWDWSKSTIQATSLPEADKIIKKSDLEGEVFRSRFYDLEKVAKKSSDFWRQVGAMVWGDTFFLTAYNKHMPNEYVPYIDGDPRQSFKPGEFNEIYTSLHAEKWVISQAARKGFSLEGMDLFVTVFPCNDCANQIVETGIKRIYFTGGYSNLNGVKTLREHGIELVYVEL